MTSEMLMLMLVLLKVTCIVMYGIVYVWFT